MSEELRVLCCFCGKDSTFHNSIEITIQSDKNTDEVQAVYAHAKCLNKVLHRSVPRGFEFKT